MMGMKKHCALILFVLFLTACGTSANEPVAQAEPETAVLETTASVVEEPTPTIAVVPTDLPTSVPEPAEATAIPTDVPAAEEVVAEPIAEESAPETAVISGRTEEGAFFYGNPNAPITLIDYSDFL